MMGREVVQWIGELRIPAWVLQFDTHNPHLKICMSQHESVTLDLGHSGEEEQESY